MPNTRAYVEFIQKPWMDGATAQRLPFNDRVGVARMLWRGVPRKSEGTLIQVSVSGSTFAGIHFVAAVVV